MLLEVKNLSLRYSKSQIPSFLLQSISFNLEAGKSVAIVGKTGAGKSSLLRALLGLLAPAFTICEGDILFQGKNLLILRDSEMRSLRSGEIAVAFQEVMESFNPVLSIGQQIQERLEVRGALPIKAGAKSKVISKLKELGFDDPDRIYYAYPHELSGGMRQRAMLAMALIGEPQLLIVDEITSHLDAEHRAEVLALIESEKNKRAMGVVFVSHDLVQMRKCTDEILVLHEGRIVERLNTQQRIEEFQHPYTRALFESSLEARKNVATISRTKPLLSVRGLSKSFVMNRERLSVLKNISLDVYPGETLGLVGPSGIGKSLLAKCILRLCSIDSGEVIFNEKALHPLSQREMRLLRREMQIIFQDPYASLNPKQRVRSILELPLQIHGLVKKNRELDAQIHSLLDLVQLPSRVLEAFPDELSGGEQQRVGIARALAMRPKLLILDEPVSQLDVLVQKQILELLSQLQEKFKLSYLLISHDPEVTAYLSHRIIRMERGQIPENHYGGSFLNISSANNASP